MLALILLNKEKSKLNSIQTREKLGFLYNGYKNEYYYWEVVIMYRKILMVIIAVVIANLGVITQVNFIFTSVGFGSVYVINSILDHYFEESTLCLASIE